MGQALNSLAMPPPSRPRWGSTAPTFGFWGGGLWGVTQGCLGWAGIEANTADPLWEPSSPGEAAKAVYQALNSLAMPPPSRPRWGSTAPTFDLWGGGLWGVTQGCLGWARIEANTADPLWEPSSPGEAAKAVGQARNTSAMPPPSRPRWGSTAPTFDLWGGGLWGVTQGCLGWAGIEANTADPLWEPSSPGEAAKAVYQALNSLAMPPPSRPRWGSTAPTFDLWGGGLWGVTQGCLGWARIEANPADPLWEPSSPGEAAKAVGQALNSLAMPPPSRPRLGSTAPTFGFWGGGLWGVTQGCLGWARIEANTAVPLWEPSSPGEAAKAVCQALNSLAMPPPSRPRWRSTAPTFGFWGGGLWGVTQGCLR